MFALGLDLPAQAPLQRLHFDWLERAGVQLAVLRLDLLDAQLGGNKWFKLLGHLHEAREQGACALASLGGAHSNHLHALAAAAQRFGFASHGLLRGEPQDTPTVRDLQAFGMQLHWLGYGGYRERHRADFWDAWRARLPGLYCIDEGGAGLVGARGCQQLVGQVQAQRAALGWDDYDGWWLAAGTGTTLAGILLGEAGCRPVHGASAVPAGHGLERRIAAVLAAAGRPELAAGCVLHDASRGGFARVDGELAAFIHACESAQPMLLEPLYTGKALLALRSRVQDGYFAAGTRLVFVHSGGLQGRRALQPWLASCPAEISHPRMEQA